MSAFQAGIVQGRAEAEQEIAELRARVVELERPTSAADATALVGALWVAGVVERGGDEVIERVQRALDYVRRAGSAAQSAP